MAKAIGLISGGLDSLLATLILKEQGINIIGVNFYTGFCITETRKRKGLPARNLPAETAEKTGIELRIIDVSAEYMEIVTRPRYGYGKNSNPCIDCRILMLTKAREIMLKENADFVYTGEVVGERPMTQMKPQLMLIEKEAGLQGYLLRPLSAKLLPPTIPEKEGIVDRSKLYAIKGRSRKPQMRLAKKFGIDDYPQPAGGCCFLTDETFARRFFDLMTRKTITRVSHEDVVLLTTGRHFKLNEKARLIVGRNEVENRILQQYASHRIMLAPVNAQGPVALIDGDVTEEDIKRAASFLARYCKGREGIFVEIIKRGEPPFSISTHPERPEVVELFMV